MLTFEPLHSTFLMKILQRQILLTQTKCLTQPANVTRLVIEIV